MVGDEERCGPICISLSDLSEGEGRAPKARWELLEKFRDMRLHVELGSKSIRCSTLTISSDFLD